MTGKIFVSAVFATINLKNGLVKLARGGHCPIILLKNKNILQLKPSGIALGFNCSNLFENNLEEISFELNQNDILVLYTDGVTEARDQKPRRVWNSKIVRDIETKY